MYGQGANSFFGEKFRKQTKNYTNTFKSPIKILGKVFLRWMANGSVGSYSRHVYWI